MEEKELIDFECTSCSKNKNIDLNRVISKLDEYLSKNDMDSALRHLLYWKMESKNYNDLRSLLSIENELIGIYRKTRRKDEGLNEINEATTLALNIYGEKHVTTATTYLNSATCYKEFDDNIKAYDLYSKALDIHSNTLDKDDYRLGALYNNMAITSVSISKYDEALDFYNKAIDVMKANNKDLEIAMTYLNIANLIEAKENIKGTNKEIDHYLLLAKEIFDSENVVQDSYYAFVLSKCESVFSYYGYFMYANELKERSKAIYERARLS